MMRATAPNPMPDASLLDVSTALSSSGEALARATLNVLELLHLSGLAGTPGDTADDLSTAMTSHAQLLHEFSVTVRNGGDATHYKMRSRSSHDAYQVAAVQQGDKPCSISVIKAPDAMPTRSALLAAHRILGIQEPLDEAMKNDSLAIVIRRVSRKQLVHLSPVDLKRRAAHDYD